MIFKRKASDIMTSDVIVAGVNNSFSQVLDFFTQYRIRHLPIMEGEKLIGIISVNDLLGFVASALRQGDVLDLGTLNARFRIQNVMTPDPITVEYDAPLREILEILSRGKFQAVPVVHGKSLRGIITNKDIARIYHYDASHIL